MNCVYVVLSKQIFFLFYQKSVKYKIDGRNIRI